MTKRYAVYQIIKNMGFPMYRESFPTKAEAQAYVVRMGGNNKLGWFKIKLQRLT